MLQRFAEIFDEELINRIKNSSIENDWHDVGWRGIMLDNGIIWVDYDGSMIATNYRTTIQSKLLENSIQKDREKLNISSLSQNPMKQVKASRASIEKTRETL